MHSEREQSWRVLVTAKANKFNFRLRFIAATPTHKPTSNFSFSFFRLSILLNLPKFALSINSHPTQPTRFIKFLHRFRPPLLKKKEPNAPHRKDLIRIIGFWVVGLLSCLALSVFMNGQRGIVMLSYVGSLLLLFRKLKMAKVMNLNMAGRNDHVIVDAF
ncbi:uncharacterized protein LOC109816750 isoform X4 [Cajanus cajan]|uniref:uncharacterized protein LOC109816750 isoform X4 n=1 Tax=Cajanus cajan TaxID=3821 RepID=UPI00098DB631|nr:uncharacterized protein LOC109816750 isoform X4 [Cajanus cajan]